MTKALLIAAALMISPVASQAAGLQCKSARLGLELAVPLQGQALTGSVTLTRVQSTLLEVKPDRVRDLVVTPTSVSFIALAADSEETILKFEATKNEYDRFVGYILYAHSQIGFVCTQN